MKRSVLVILLLIISKLNIVAQKKLQLRISLGNGKPFYSNGIIYSNINSPNVQFGKYNNSYNRVFNRILSNPQIGYMLEYKIDSKNTLGFGLQMGRTELNFTSNKYISSDGAPLKKIGIEYTRTRYFSDLASKKTNSGRYYFSVIGSLSLVNHTYNYYENGIGPFTLIDQNGNTTDSLTDKLFPINKHGFIGSVGFRIGKLNKKGNEKFSLTIQYDHGFTKLWQKNTNTYFNYLTDYTIATQVARGSQLKIYLSFPIGIYNFETSKFSWKK